MCTLFFIGLLGVFSYHCASIHKEFRGASKAVKVLTGLAGNIGYLVYYGVLIWSFWHFTWWQPIVTYIGAMIVGGLTAPLFQGTAFGIIGSPFFVIIFSILSIISLILN